MLLLLLCCLTDMGRGRDPAGMSSTTALALARAHGRKKPMALLACPCSQRREHSSGVSQGIWPLFSVQCRW